MKELRESALACFRRGLWEAAATDLERLLASADSVVELAPKLITCLLNAHSELFTADAIKIEKLLSEREAAGYSEVATPLRQQHAAKLKPDQSRWWKFW